LYISIQLSRITMCMWTTRSRNTIWTWHISCFRVLLFLTHRRTKASTLLSWSVKCGHVIGKYFSVTRTAVDLSVLGRAIWIAARKGGNAYFCGNSETQNLFLGANICEQETGFELSSGSLKTCQTSQKLVEQEIFAVLLLQPISIFLPAKRLFAAGMGLCRTKSKTMNW